MGQTYDTPTLICLMLDFSCANQENTVSKPKHMQENNLLGFQKKIKEKKRNCKKRGLGVTCVYLQKFNAGLWVSPIFFSEVYKKKLNMQQRVIKKIV